MRKLGKLILTSSLLIGSLPAMAESDHRNYQEIFDDVTELERGALLLSTRARQAGDFVSQELTDRAHRDLSRKADRLTRELNIRALGLADLIVGNASLADIESCLEEIEVNYFQMARLKNELRRAYRSERRDIDKAFNPIRSTFFFLKDEIHQASQLSYE